MWIGEIIVKSPQTGAYNYRDGSIGLLGRRIKLRKFESGVFYILKGEGGKPQNIFVKIGKKKRQKKILNEVVVRKLYVTRTCREYVVTTRPLRSSNEICLACLLWQLRKLDGTLIYAYEQDKFWKEREKIIRERIERAVKCPKGYKVAENYIRRLLSPVRFNGAALVTLAPWLFLFVEERIKQQEEVPAARGA